MKTFTILLLGALSTACGVLVPACTLAPNAAITVTVRDSTTSDPVVPDTVIAARWDGLYADTVVSADGLSPIALAFGHSGAYRLTVAASGYRTWTREWIHVSGDDCGHPKTVAVSVRLQK